MIAKLLGPGGARAVIADSLLMKQQLLIINRSRIAQQINKVFETDIDKDVVRRILAAHYRPDPGKGGPLWLTFIGNTKGSLWSLVVMDHFTRRIVGFGIHAGYAGYISFPLPLEQ